MNKKNLKSLKLGDIVARNFAGLKISLEITEITDTLIFCGPWSFDKVTGAEVDEELGWGNYRTGSYITAKNITD